MSEIETRYQAALNAARELFSTRSVSAYRVVENLETLVDEINMMIEALNIQIEGETDEEDED